MEQKYNTNLASEFYVMSMLYRLGLDAYLTLGNKKGVDIVLRNTDGSSISIEVKGVNKKTDDWPLSSKDISLSANLFYILISYESEIGNLLIHPHLWIIPANLIADKCKKAQTKTGKYLYYMSHKVIREQFDDYKNNWQILQTQLLTNTNRLFL
ncbi:MAG: hypothetical protein V5804_17220 [Mucilaginibacter sp.]|uniref:hypothetical protein n=1 Tax=Mucilaginibacter sp. TaxID=1882438 RepID=UPI0034E4F8FA